MREYPDAIRPNATPQELTLHSVTTEAIRLPGNQPVRVEQLLRPEKSPPPKHPLKRVRSFWQQDPAHKVLLIAVGTVCAAGLLFVSLLSLMFLQNPDLFGLNNIGSQNPPSAVISAETVDLHPTFAPPGGGKGSSASSQPPQQSTPSIQQTVGASPTVPPSPSPTGTLTVQISTIPSQVMDFTRVLVGVTTNEPGVTVTLVITYNAPPYKGFAGPRTTNESGNANIPWHVTVFDFHRHFTATVTAYAVDANGQKAQSQTVTVKVLNLGGN